jgi:hypothetical protein
MIRHSKQRKNMKQLTGLDASFLYMETPEMPMHVGALHLFELPASYKGSFLADMRKHMATRLAIAPALRRKLAWMPFNLANPVWVDALPDLDQTIVGVKLPKGSGLAELQQQVGKLHPLLLDRSVPLWKFYVFEGLAPGPNKEKRFGLYTKIHHAGVDGQAAVALAQAILDLGPQAARHRGRCAPGEEAQHRHGRDAERVCSRTSCSSTPTSSRRFRRRSAPCRRWRARVRAAWPASTVAKVRGKAKKTTTVPAAWASRRARAGTLRSRPIVPSPL